MAAGDSGTTADLAWRSLLPAKHGEVKQRRPRAPGRRWWRLEESLVADRGSQAAPRFLWRRGRKVRREREGKKKRETGKERAALLELVLAGSGGGRSSSGGGARQCGRAGGGSRARAGAGRRWGCRGSGSSDLRSGGPDWVESGCGGWLDLDSKRGGRRLRGSREGIPRGFGWSCGGMGHLPRI